MKQLFFLLVTLSFGQIFGQNMFSDSSMAINAYNSGKFSYYQPKFFNHKGENPINGKNKTLAPAEKDAVVDMATANGRRWVILEKGVFMRWENNFPYAHDACGNKIFSFSYIQKEEKKVVSSLAFKPADTTTINVNVKVNVDGYHSPQINRAAYPAPLEESSWLSRNWGWVAGGVVTAAAAIIFWPKKSTPAAPIYWGGSTH